MEGSQSVSSLPVSSIAAPKNSTSIDGSANPMNSIFVEIERTPKLDDCLEQSHMQNSSPLEGNSVTQIAQWKELIDGHHKECHAIEMGVQTTPTMVDASTQNSKARTLTISPVHLTESIPMLDSNPRTSFSNARKPCIKQFDSIYGMLAEPRLLCDPESRLITTDEFESIEFHFQSNRAPRAVRNTLTAQGTQTEVNATSSRNEAIQTNPSGTSETSTQVDLVYQPLDVLPIPNSADPELNWLYDQWNFLKDELDYVQSCLDILDLNSSNI
jgi:hypothetical protein